MKLTDLRAILQYVPQFRERTFIIAVDGGVVADENFANILLDIALLRSLNIRVVVVHGAAEQIATLAQKQNIQPSNLDGAGVLHEIMAGLSANDLGAAATNAVGTVPLGIIHGVDHLFTGKVERIDTILLEPLLSQGIVPVVSPIGFSSEGKSFRVNSDNVAVAVAIALKAVKLVFITSQNGLHYNGQLIRHMVVTDLQKLLQAGARGFAPEMVSKASHAVAACSAGVPRVHIVNGHEDEALLAEVFSSEGAGTLIYANEYEQIRQARKKDIRAIQQLTKKAVEAEELLRRTREEMEKHFSEYYIFEIDKNPIACVSLHVYVGLRKGELASLYVDPSYGHQGIGQKLMRFVEDKARELGLSELIALSTQTFSFFELKGGFVEGTLDDLPQERRDKYNQSGRNSKVLIKKLNVPALGNPEAPHLVTAES
jgi:amino-acid N-acetyltransferase